jgi:hypothetical protein
MVLSWMRSCIAAWANSNAHAPHQTWKQAKQGNGTFGLEVLQPALGAFQVLPVLYPSALKAWFASRCDLIACFWLPSCPVPTLLTVGWRHI